eukprot:TRINITY_DN1542_c0_g1_i1.p1 TRINITY_DN1542_c0_g1~~TRINITY_DN1542_c0_g1_i1.p1  ORF type:complete len:157 (+),score=13.21 TRINITY_DN1542_c0_g1_i1:182-652(+)
MSSIRVEEQPDHSASTFSHATPQTRSRNPISRHRRSVSATAFEEIVSALPKEFLAPSTRRAALGLLSSIAILTVGYWLTAISPWFFLPILWAFLGAAYAGVRLESFLCRPGTLPGPTQEIPRVFLLRFLAPGWNLLVSASGTGDAISISIRFAGCP